MNPWILSISVAYLLGSIPFGYLLVRIFRKEDVRAQGSGNIGATNVARSGGKGLGVATLLLFHVLVNVGMVVGRMPVTGIPLPLMSSGGSNMFSVFMMLGLVNNVRLRRFVS